MEHIYWYCFTTL